MRKMELELNGARLELDGTLAGRWNSSWKVGARLELEGTVAGRLELDGTLV